MIRLVLRLAALGGAMGWVADRILAARAQGEPPEPIRSVIVIEAPIERVWAVLADVEDQPRWMRDMKAVRVLTSGRIGVGTRAEADVRIFGIGVVDPITIMAFEPPRLFAIRHEGRFNGEGRFELEPGADGTTTVVRWDEWLRAPYLPHLGAAVLGPILRQVFQADLVNLRDLVEAGTERS